MRVSYYATKRFDPQEADDLDNRVTFAYPHEPTAPGVQWPKYIEWSKLTQLREVVSLDGILNCNVFDNDEENSAEDWEHIDLYLSDNETGFVTYKDLDYLLKKSAGRGPLNILAIIQNPTDGDMAAFADPRFEFRGFDLADKDFGMSALVNCGGFDKAFANSELSDCGLISSLSRADEVRGLLRQNYPDGDHTDCDVWAIWLMTRGT